MSPTPEELLSSLVATPPLIPTQAAAAASRQLVDCIGVTLAASTHDAGKVIQGVLGRHASGDGARILGSVMRTSPSEAAFCNGSMAHLLDFDDTGFSHPTACILPAALAVAEEESSSGAELVAAMVIGYEVFERLAVSARPNEPALRQRGVHPTSVWGAPASAAAAASLIGLDSRQCIVALGIAATAAWGITQQFGSWSKGLNAGNAARAGVVAAYLAQAGYQGDPHGISGPYGLMSAVVGEGAFDLSRVGEGLGETWAIVDPGLSIKPYPACTSTLRAVDAMLLIASDETYASDRVATISVEVHPDLLHTLRFKAPTKGFNGKFSLDYTVASAALDGQLSLASFDDASANRPELRRMLDRVKLVEHPEWDLSRRHENPVEVLLKDGSVLRESVPAHLGSPSNPVSDKQVSDKFLTCATTVLGEEGATKALFALWDAGSATEVGDLLDLVTPAE